MDFTIEGLLFERLTNIAKILQCESEDLIHEVVRKGLEQVELQNKKKNLLNLEPINGNLQTEEFDQKWKDFVSSHLNLSNRQIHGKIGIPINAVKSLRWKLAGQHILAKPETSDAEMMKMFGIGLPRVRQIRLDQGISHKVGDLTIFVFEHKKEIIDALTNGGKTIIDLIRENKLEITRERLRQKLLEIGVNGSHHSAMWYANKYGHPELGDKEFVQKRLAETKTASGLARETGISEVQMAQIISKHGLVTPSSSRSKVLKMECAGNCGKELFVLERIVNMDLKKNPGKKFWHKKCWGRFVGQNYGKGRKKSA
jgi:hypothetical protein